MHKQVSSNDSEIVKSPNFKESLWTLLAEMRGIAPIDDLHSYLFALLLIKHASENESPIKIPEGANFDALNQFGEQPNLCHLIDHEIAIPISRANEGLDFPRFSKTENSKGNQGAVNSLLYLIEAVGKGELPNFIRRRNQQNISRNSLRIAF